MLGTLIKKDLQRLRVNWRGFAILLAMPLCITGLVGSVFGPAARSGEMPRIKIAVVNEDDEVIGGLLTNAMTGEQAAEFLDASHTVRDQAMQLVNDNQISAVVVIPTDFSTEFLAGKQTPRIELIKNPAQAYMPAITEELLRVVAELLNAVSQNLMVEMPEFIEVFEEDGAPDTVKLAKVITRIGNKFERSEAYLFPPIIGLESVEEQNESDSQATGGGFNIFAFVMPGMAAMFLLFAANGSTSDLFVERRTKTLDRYRTICSGLSPLFVAKSIYSLVVVLFSAVTILVGGGLIFGITWKCVLEMTLLTLSYSVFCVGFAYLLIAVIYREKLASILNTVAIMMMAFLGGSMMPTQNLPPVIRDTIAPCMPNYAFAESIKRLQFDTPGPHWAASSLGLVTCGSVMLIVAIMLFQRRLIQGAAE